MVHAARRPHREPAAEIDNLTENELSGRTADPEKGFNTNFCLNSKLINAVQILTSKNYVLPSNHTVTFESL